METDEGLYHATPQTRGRIAHEKVDNKKANNRAEVLLSKIQKYGNAIHRDVDVAYF